MCLSGGDVERRTMTPELQRVARRQAGCFTRRQARQCGLSVVEIDRRVLDGDWHNVMGDVLIVTGAPVSEAMKAWTAVLSIGQPVALAAMSAGRWIDLERVPMPERPQLVVPDNRHPRDIPGLEVRRVAARQWGVRWFRGLPTTPIAMTIRDIAGDVSTELTRDVVQHALRRRRVSFEALAQTLGRGVSGSAALRSVLEEVGPGFHVKWERMLHRALLDEGVRMKPQTRVEAPDGRAAFIDLGIEELRFGVEIDGFLNHMARFAADRRRARMLALELDWTIAPYAVEELTADLRGAAREIARHVRALRVAAA